MTTKPIFIVALGASAGGLRPMLTFFDSTPNDHASYIIVQHLHPEFKSQLGVILKKHSKLEIVEAEDGTLIDPNKIYVLPAKLYMTIKDRRLYLQARSNFPLYPNIAINLFLKSLAEEKGNPSIAVIFSGTGSDGAQGVTKIKKNGGLVIVQNAQSCEHSSMPVSAIKTGAVDYELLPEEMPGTILKQIDHWIKVMEQS